MNKNPNDVNKFEDYINNTFPPYETATLNLKPSTNGTTDSIVLKSTQPELKINQICSMV